MLHFTILMTALSVTKTNAAVAGQDDDEECQQSSSRQTRAERAKRWEKGP
jgi:hypothetical protein